MPGTPYQAFSRCMARNRRFHPSNAPEAEGALRTSRSSTPAASVPDGGNLVQKVDGRNPTSWEVVYPIAWGFPARHGGIPTWMVYNGKSHSNARFLRKPPFLGFQPSFWWCRISQPSTVGLLRQISGWFFFHELGSKSVWGYTGRIWATTYTIATEKKIEQSFTLFQARILLSS